MTPFTVFILGYLAYAIWVFRAPKDETELRDGAPIRGHMPSQVAWLATTTVAVLFLAIFGTTELLADNGSGSGSGPEPGREAERSRTAGAGDRPAVGVHLPLSDLRRRRDGGSSSCLPARVAFHVTSLDAVHSFWAYELGVKADANPGVDNVAYVKPAKTGTFQIRCAELCGLWHGYMFDTGRVVSAAVFKTWIEARRAQFAGRSEVPAEVQPDLFPRPDLTAPDEPAPTDRVQPLDGGRLRRRRLLRRLVARPPISGPSIAYFSDTHQNDIALFIAYLVGVIGFLVGLGFANYPVQRLLGKPPSLREKEQQGLARYFGLCTDHKVVGIQYLLGIGAFIFIGGLNAMLIRFELMRPQHLVWNGNNYLTLVGCTAR